MDQYNFLADMLSKFHTSSDIVKTAALASFSIFFVTIGFLLRTIIICAKDAISLYILNQPEIPKGKLLYTLEMNNDEEHMLVFRHKDLGLSCDRVE